MSKASVPSDGVIPAPEPAAPEPTTAPREDAAAGGFPWVRWLLFLLLAAGAGLAFVYEPAGDAAAAKAKPAAGPKAVAVYVGDVQRGTIAVRASYVGELDADAADVGADVAGRLLELSVRLGDRVQAGAVIARVDDKELQRQLGEARAQERAAAAMRTRAVSQLAAARKELERTRKLVDDELVSAQQVETLEARVSGLEADLQLAGAQREEAKARVTLLTERIADCQVVAPFSGRVVDRLRDPGTHVQAGTGLVRLVADETLRVRFEVPEDDVPRLSEGAEFQAWLPSRPGQRVRGVVSGIASEVDRTRRVVLVEGTLSEGGDARPSGWLPGMFVEVELTQERHEDVLLVPGEAIVERLDETGAEFKGVFRALGDKAALTKVRVISREGDRVAVEGVAAGDRVVTTGHATLSDGSPIRVVEAGGGE